MSKKETATKKAVEKEEASKMPSAKKDETPTPQDHYVYEAIIAEIGY